jgi:TRAP-type uncharacterized transport system substrate-binding protein
VLNVYNLIDLSILYKPNQKEIAMKKSILAMATIAVMTSSVAMAEGPRIAGGKAEGVYIRYASNIASALRDDDAYTKANAPVVMETKGSVENLELLNSGKADIALVQADAFMKFVNENADALNNIDMVGQLPREECLFLVMRKDGDITSAKDLEKSSTRIAIGASGTGQNASWHYVTTLHPAYDKAAKTERDGEALLGKVIQGGKYGLDAYFFTGPANVTNMVTDNVNLPGSKLKFVDFSNSDLKGSLPNGEPVYNIRDVQVMYEQNTSLMNSGKVEVPCTTTLVVTSTNIDSKLADKIAKLANRNVARIADIGTSGKSLK